MNAEKLQRSLAASDGAEKLRKDFELLLGSASKARRQVENLAEAASSSAFTFEALAQASKNLQVLTRGALNTAAGLKRVEDVAAATGSPVDQVAAAVGRLYAALERGGDGAQAAAEDLRSMGILSQQTTEKVKALSAAGASLGASWQVVQQDLSRSSGAASELAGTLSGLQQQLASLQNQSDIKIGDMMVEGEKAALRAAIGWQKLNNAVSEANQAPWAAVNQAFQGINQSIGEFVGKVAESGAVKSVFSSIATASIGVLTGLTAATIAAIPVLLKLGAGALGAVAKYLAPFAARLGITTASVGTFAATLRKVAFNPFTVGMTAIATVATMAASKILEGASAVGALTEKMKEFNRERGKSGEQALVDAQTVRTPEDKRAAQDRIRGNIAASQERVRDLRENALPEARRMKGNFLTVKAGTEMERTALNAISMESNFQQSQGAALDMLADRSVGFDQQRLEMAERRAALEKEIAEDARRAVQGSTSAANASEMADAKVKKSEAKLAEAEKASKNRFEDEGKMAQGARDFEKSRTERAAYDQAKDVEAAEYRKKIAESSPSMKHEIDRALEEGDYSTLSNFADRGIIQREDLNKYQAAMAKSGGDRPELNYAAFDVGAVSKSGKIDSEIARRTALQMEEQDAIRRGSKSDLVASRLKMADLKNPLTGASEFEGDKVMGDLQSELGVAIADGDQGAQDEIRARIGEYASKKMGNIDQRLNSDLKVAKGEENTVAAREEVENDRIAAQAAAEGAAADKAAQAAGERKLAIQKQLAALQGVEGGDGRAAEMELGPEIQQLQEKLKAVKEAEAAEKAYNEALNGGDQKKIDAALANRNAKKVAAAGAGAQAGETSASVDQELKGTEQILKIRQQQAAVEQAAAQARRDGIMQELRLRQQISQLAFSNATGTTGEKGGQSETDLKIADVQRTRSRAEEAADAVAERDALRESGAKDEKGNLIGGDADREQELNKRIAALGFDKNTNSQDIQSMIKDSDSKEAELRNQQIGANRDIARSAKIQQLAAQEKFAPTQEARQEAKKAREVAEDEATVEAKTAEYSKTMDRGLAKELATAETRLERVRTMDEETGTPRVDSLTAVGGGATGFIGANPVDIQKEIKTKTVELADTLKKVNEALRDQTALGKVIQTKMEEG